MRSFFESMTPWDRDTGSLHLYVLPDETTADRLERLQDRLVDVVNLPVMPRAWLHATVSRLAQFDDVGQAGLTRLGDALTEELAGMAGFSLSFGGAEVHDTAVGCQAAPSAAWDALVDAVRRAAVSVFPDPLPERPHAPHVSLAYATGEVDDAEVHARLAGAAAVGAMPVTTVSLCSVTVRPALGTFDFLELATWPLG